MTTISINGSSYNGSSINVTNGKIIIDGKDVTPDSKEIIINVEGNVDDLMIDYCNKIQINGDVGKVKTGSGNVNCKNVTGNVQTGSGDVEAEAINGDVETGSGDVKSKIISGSVKTRSGDIN